MSSPRSILISGASSGIGEALARHYAGETATLFLSGRDADRLGAVSRACEALGSTVDGQTIDVTDQAAMHTWISSSDTNAALDLVVANAGISGGTSGGIESAAQTQQIFEVNVKGVLNTVLPALERMTDRGHGQIAIVSSLAGFLPLPGAPAYSASKASIRHFGEALRISAARRGVGISVICPGFVHSRMTAANPFSMPFIMPAEKAARIIAAGLARNRARIAFPWPMYWSVRILGSLIPLGLCQTVLGRLPEKPSTGGTGT